MDDVRPPRRRLGRRRRGWLQRWRRAIRRRRRVAIMVTAMLHIMTKRQLLNRIDAKAIESAIEEAEHHTTGEIVVSIAPFFFGSVEKLARRAFERLRVEKTKDRNGVLLFVVPARRRLVLLGDEGIHAKVGQDFWETVISKVSLHFTRGEYTDGLIDGVALVGLELARHFPLSGDEEAHDELLNRIDFFD